MEQHVSARWIKAGDQSALPCSVRLKKLVDAPAKPSHGDEVRLPDEQAVRVAAREARLTESQQASAATDFYYRNWLDLSQRRKKIMFPVSSSARTPAVV